MVRSWSHRSSLRNLCVQQQSRELSFFVGKCTKCREMFLFHTSPISSTKDSFVHVTLLKRKRIQPAYDIFLSCSSVPESANLRYFPRRYLWTWTLTHTNNFLSFLSVLWNVSFCWSMLVTLLPPRLKCPIMLFHKISWNEILSFMLKCHWINDIQESKVSSFINFIICKFIVINIAFYK